MQAFLHCRASPLDMLRGLRELDGFHLLGFISSRFDSYPLACWLLARQQA
jgi:hypothetical protein